MQKTPVRSLGSDILILAVFIAANIIKITAFNALLIPVEGPGFILEKVLTTLLMAGIIYPVFYISRSRILIIGTYLLQAFYIASSIIYYLYFHTYLHFTQAATLLSEAFSTAANSAVPLDPRAFISILDLPFFIILMQRIWKTAKPTKIMRRTALLIMAFSLLAFSVTEAYRHVNKQSFMDIVRDTYSGESPIIERYGTFAANLLSLWQNLNGHTWEKQLKYGSEKTAAATLQPVPNFVIVQIESMDAAIVNKKYKGFYVTPFLHSLTSSAVYYPYMLSYHEGGGTSDCEFSILNSVEPLSSYPALKLSDYNYPNSLLARLDKNGYATCAFHGNKGSFYNRDAAFPRMGFQGFYDMVKMGLPEKGWGIPDGDTFTFASGRLNSAKQPFLAYVITMSSHEPFNSVSGYYNNSLFKGVEDKTVKDYFNSMSYVDRSLKDFINRVKAGFTNTFIIITGDHTPNISKAEFKQASFAMDNRYFEFVPLFIITPDGKTYRERSIAASFLDMAPTILKASGIGFTILTDGKDLLDPGEKAGNIPFRGNSYNRGSLYKKAAESVR